MKIIKETFLVLLICSLLGIIVLPVFSTSKLLEEKNHCLSNLQAIGNALAMYVNDNNGTYPLGRSHTSGTWQQVLSGYVQYGEVFFCPSSDRKPDYNKDVNWNIINLGLNHNYGANFGVLGDFDNDTTIKQYPARKYSETKQPETLMCICESKSYIFEPKIGSITSKDMFISGMGLKGYTCSFEDPWEKNDFYKGRHDQGMNVLYADGHAGFVKSYTHQRFTYELNIL